MARSRYVRSLAIAAVIGAVLVTALPDLPALIGGLAAPERWVLRDGLDVVLGQVVGAVAWLTALWLAVGFVLVAASRLPGVAGRTSAALARGALPAGLRGAAAIALGAGLATSAVPADGLLNAAAEGLGTPSAAASSPEAWPAGVDRIPSRATLTGHPADAPPPRTSATIDRPTTPLKTASVAFDRHAEDITSAAVDWPQRRSSREVRPSAAVGWPAAAIDEPEADRSEKALPAAAVDWPLGATPKEVRSAAAVDGPQRDPSDDVRPAAAVDEPQRDPSDDVRPAAAVDWPLGATRKEMRPATAVEWPSGSGEEPSATPRSVTFSPGTEPVIVAPGDTLWSIASRRLGPGAQAPAIAAEWRRWHAANRALIGSDPRRLRPGTALLPPTA